MWALGILLFVMLVGKFPYKGTNDIGLFRNIIKGNLKIPSFISNSARNLLEKILVNDPSQRISAKRILEDEWFGKLHWY